MNKNFISTKKTYIAPTAKFVIVDTQHLMAGSTGTAGSDSDQGTGTGNGTAKDGIFTTDEFNF